MSADDGGLLGDLPRHRPGTRSARRPAPAQDSASEGAPEPDRGRAPLTAGETASGSLRLAVGAAEAGLKVASRLTGELIRRLPRP